MKLSTESTVINDSKLNTDIDNAQTSADNAQASADNAQASANQAKTIADNTAQNFWFKSTGSDTGAHITEVSQSEFEASPSGGNLLARSNGIAIRDGLAELAVFNDGYLKLGRYKALYDVKAEIGTYFRLTQARGTIGDEVNLEDEIAYMGYDTEKGIAYFTLGSRNDEYEIGDYSVAEGAETAASGLRSHAEGSYTVASGDWGSHAEGNNSVASGDDGSHAEGESTIASGQYSHTQNYKTIAGYSAQTAIGQCNDNQGDTALEIGNGSDSIRSNALTVDWRGNTKIAGTLTQSSDRRLKDHIKYLGEDADEFVRKLKPAHFKKDDADHVGFYAQDVENADKWNCMVDEMNGYKTLGYTELIAPLVAYCQHLEKRIEELERSKNE